MYKPMPCVYLLLTRVESMMVLLPLSKSHISVSTILNSIQDYQKIDLVRHLRAIICIATNNHELTTKFYRPMMASTSFQISKNRPFLVFEFCNDIGIINAVPTANYKGGFRRCCNRIQSNCSETMIQILSLLLKNLRANRIVWCITPLIGPEIVNFCSYIAIRIPP